ncbi:MAG: NAD(P)-dependent oxidoreductase [Sphingobium sp.]
MLDGKKVLLTGLTGRLGGAFAASLAPRTELWGYARFSNGEVRAQMDAMGVRTVQGDFSSGEFAGLPDDFDYVVHCAAAIYTRDAEDGMRNNADGSALLMGHCRKAKAFLHVSTTGVYRQNDDPAHAYRETDDLGGNNLGQYCPTKLAAEGAVRGAALLLGLPTVMARMNVQYGGPWSDGALLGKFLDMMIAGEPIIIPRGKPCYIGLIHDDDLVDLIEPTIGIASVPASIVNWGGDEAVEWSAVMRHMGDLLGLKPNLVETDDFPFPSCFPDPTRRREIAGPCKVQWRDGIRRLIEARRPEALKAA